MFNQAHIFAYNSSSPQLNTRAAILAQLLSHTQLWFAVFFPPIFHPHICSQTMMAFRRHRHLFFITSLLKSSHLFPIILPLFSLLFNQTLTYDVGQQQDFVESPFPETMTRQRPFIRSRAMMPERIVNKPLYLYTSMSIESISEIQNNFAILETYLTETWYDPGYNNGEAISMSGFGIDFYDWIPDTYFLLSKSFLCFFIH